MKRDSGRTRWFLTAALPLALWAAVPSIRWCPLGWSEVSEHLADCLSSPAAILNVGTTGCCERSCQPARDVRCRAEGMASCPLGRTCASSSCDRASTPDPGSHAGGAYPGGRAFCLGAPAGGDGVRPAPPTAPGLTALAAILPATTLAPLPITPADRPVAAPLAHPPPSPVSAVPRVRAPPQDLPTC